MVVTLPQFPPTERPPSGVPSAFFVTLPWTLPVPVASSPKSTIRCAPQKTVMVRVRGEEARLERAEGEAEGLVVQTAGALSIEKCPLASVDAVLSPDEPETVTPSSGAWVVASKIVPVTETVAYMRNRLEVRRRGVSAVTCALTIELQ